MPLLELAVGGTALYAAILNPSFSPVRAIWLALGSRFAFKPDRVSLRHAEMKLLRSKIAQGNFGTSPFVVTGELGVGKTCFLLSVTSKLPGVVNLSLSDNQARQEIVMDTLKQVTGMTLTNNFLPVHKRAKRVLFWYHFFTGGRSPIIVIKSPITGTADALPGAIRTLIKEYKLWVIVDSSSHSADERLKRSTHHTRIINIQHMTREMIRQLDQLKELFKYVDKVPGLEDTIFAVLGGIPASYEQLSICVRFDLRKGGPEVVQLVIGEFLCSEVYYAIRTVMHSQLKTNDMQEIIKLFDKERNCIATASLTVHKLKRPIPDHVFCKVERDGEFVLVPASNAIGIVLRNGLKREPTFNELEDLVKQHVWHYASEE